MSDEIQKSEVESDIVDVSEFLSLKLLGRDAKVRASDAFDATQWAGNSSLFAVSNKLGWFVAGTPTGLVASPLRHLRERQSITPEDGPTPLEPKRTIAMSGAPFFVAFAAAHTRVVVVVYEGDVWRLDIFHSEDVCKDGSGDIKPQHTFALGREVVIDMHPNPSEESEIVALLRGRKSSSSCLDIINVVSATRVTSWGPANVMDENATFTSFSWSVRGKQIVAGTRGGELVQFTPEGERKQIISVPPSLSAPQAAVSVLWLENTVFHVVYGNPNSDPSDPTHEYEVYNIIFDSKAKTASYIKFTDPAPPFGLASRLSSRHYARLAGWEPTKHLVFVADGPSTDVGIVGCLNPSEAQDKKTPWATLEVDETSRLSLPMDDDMNETSIMGLDLDLTSTEEISNSKEAGDDSVPSPPSPIIHLYTSAGLIISYHILNSRDGKYPGMGGVTETVISPRPSTPPAAPKPTGFAGFGAGAGAFGATTTPKPTTPFAQPSTTPAFGVSTFGSTTPAGPPTFGSSSFGTPAKPTITFGSSTTPAFGQPSAFGAAKSSSTTPAGTPVSGGGFSAFGGKTSGFGSVGSTTPTSASTDSKSVFGSGGSAFGTNTFAFGAGSSAFGATSSATTPKSAGSGFSGFGTTAPSGFGSTTPAPVFGSATIPPASTTPAFPPPSPASTPKSTARTRKDDDDADSPTAPQASILADDEDILSPPRSPTAGSDGGFNVGSLDLGGAKKPIPGLEFSDDEDGPDPAETPSKPPPSASTFAGFGKPSAFGSVASGGAFGSTSTSGAFSGKPNAGSGAFGTKSSTPTPGFGFGSGSASANKSEGEASKPAFGGGSAFGSTTFGGSTSGFGTTAFGAAAKPASTGPAFGATSTLGASTTPKFGSPSAFGAAASADPPKSGGFASFAAPKSGESKPVGFAGFGTQATGFGGFGKPGDAKGGFLGFGDSTKKVEEKPTNQELGKEEPKETAKEEAKGTSKDVPAPPKDTVTPSNQEEPTQAVTVPSKSAFELLVSSPPPKPKVSGPTPEPTKPPGDVPSKIPVPKATSPFGLPPKPEPEKLTAESETKKDPPSENTTPPGSPTPSPPAPSAAKPTAPTGSSPFGLGKPPARPFGSAFNSAPLKSSPLASPPVTREESAKPEGFAKVDPPALVPKTPSPFAPSSAPAAPKPSTAGFFGFGKPPAADTKDKDTKPLGEQWPGSFSGTMKGVGPASVTSGSPPVPPPSKAPAASPPTATPTATTPASLFGATSKPGGSFSFATPPATSGSTPLFSVPTPKASAAAVSPLFSAPSKPALLVPPASVPPASASPAAFAGFNPPVTAANSSKPTVGSPFAAPPRTAAPASVPQTPLSHVEVEFNKLLEQMGLEFNKLRQDTAVLRERHAQRAQANVAAPTLQSISSSSRWSMGDLATLQHVTSLVAKEVNQLEGLNQDFLSQMTELQPGAEKVHAKKSEIARYIKAKKDPKYTRLLKSRTSSPEHLETQMKLRKSIQVVRDRTRQLEDFVTTQKSRMQKQKQGKREFKVPSLDTINRTMRNIDTALAQKLDDIATLTARVERLKLKAPKRKVWTNGMVPLALPAAENEKVKLASAAALNAERTSVRLKNALLQARKETPLNASAVGAPVEPKPTSLAKLLPAPTPKSAPIAAFTATPAPAPVPTPPISFAPKTPLFAVPPTSSSTPKQPTTPGFFPLSKPAAPTTPSFVLPATSTTAVANFSPLGKDEFHVTAGYEHSARRNEKSRMHGSSAKAKTPSPSASRTLSDVSPAPLPPLIPPAKSFFGTSTPAAVQPAYNPIPFSFATPGGGSGGSPSPSLSFFKAPAQATTATATPKLPPIPNWGSNSFTSSAGSVQDVSVSASEAEEAGEEEEGDEDEEGGEDDDEEDDEDWVPGEEDDDEEEEDESDGVDEGEDDDPTVS